MNFLFFFTNFFLSYEMLVGIPPFYSKNQHTMLCQIIKEKFKFPNGIKISNKAKDLINGVRKDKIEQFQQILS